MVEVETAVNIGKGVGYVERFLPLKPLPMDQLDELKRAIGDFPKVVVFCEGDASRANLARALSASLQENPKQTVAVCHYQQILFSGKELIEPADDAPKFTKQLHQKWQEFVSFPFDDLGDGAVVVVDEAHEIDKFGFWQAMEKITQMPQGIRWIFIIPTWPNFMPGEFVNLIKDEQWPCFGVSTPK